MPPQAIPRLATPFLRSIRPTRLLPVLSHVLTLLLIISTVTVDAALTSSPQVADAPSATLTTVPKGLARALQSPMQVEPEPTTLLFSSFLGGSGHETVTGMRFDTDNNAYLTGKAGSTDFPLLSPLNNTTLTGEPQTLVVQVGAPIDIAATLIPSDSHLHLGEDQTWRVEWENNGPDPATDVQVVFEFEEPGFPPSLQFKSLQNISGPSNIDISSCSGSALSGPGGTLACAVSDIPFTGGQSSAALTFTPVTAEGYSLSVEMVGRGVDTNPSNNGNSVTGEIGNIPDTTLTVDFQGSGTGRVDATPGPTTPTVTFFSPNGDQTLDYPNGTTVSLTATLLGLGDNASTFSGWSGTGCTSTNETITVEMIQDRSCTATFTANPTQRTLTVTKAPNNGGTMTGTGITCGNDCTEILDNGTVMTLTATPASGFTFTGWTVTGNPANPCPGTSTCTVNMNADRTITATFTANPVLRTLTVTTNPATGGTVTGTGINCGSDCSQTVDEGTVMTLTAAPASGFTFTGWTGCDTTPGAQCTVTLTSNRTVTATFTVNPVLRTLTVTTNPATGGTVTGTGINCGSDCSQTVDEGTVMTLTAAPVSGFTFTSWTGCDATPGALCIVTLISNRTVTATFNLNTATVPNVVGRTQAAATTALTNADLTVGAITRQGSVSVPTDSVISQDPAAGTNIAPSSAINLVILSGSKLIVTIPEDGPDASPNNGICETGTNDCTLCAAIQEANALEGEQTITLEPGTYALTIPGTNEDAAATGDLDIIGDVIIESSIGNVAEVVINGNAFYRVFDLPSGSSSSSVTLRGLTIQGGMIAGSTGGGLRNAQDAQGTLTVEDCVVTANQSNGSGGGISQLGGTLTIRNTKVTNNTSQGLGGGLQAQGSTVTIDSNTQFIDNAANFGGGLSVGRANVTVTNTRVEDNSAVGTGGAFTSS